MKIWKKFLSICLMLCYPTWEEGVTLSQLSYDENFGRNKVEKICPNNLIEKITKQSINESLNIIALEQVRWPEGLIVQVEPGYYMDKILDNNSLLYEKSIFKIIREVRKEKILQIIIVGAGTIDRKIITIIF